MVDQIAAVEPIRGKLTLPEDLAKWVDAPALLQLVEQQVEGLEWSNPQVVEMLAGQPNFKPKLLLGLILYAYARGVYEAEEVAQLPYGDELLRARYAPFAPTGRSVTRFRRENRGLVKWGLVELYRRILTLRGVVEGNHFPAGLRRHLVVLASRRIDLARMMVRGTEEA